MKPSISLSTKKLQDKVRDVLRWTKISGPVGGPLTTESTETYRNRLFRWLQRAAGTQETQQQQDLMTWLSMNCQASSTAQSQKTLLTLKF